jgi:hypothetical protein
MRPERHEGKAMKAALWLAAFVAAVVVFAVGTIGMGFFCRANRLPLAGSGPTTQQSE